MEHLLHYVWKHKLFPLKILQTTKGLLVEIIDSGLQNPDAGPDFFNAKLKIDGTLWVGNIEIHTHSSDWYRHGHDHDKTYDSVILHVVAEAALHVCVLLLSLLLSAVISINPLKILLLVEFSSFQSSFLC